MSYQKPVKGYLILENEAIFEGKLFCHREPLLTGEVVFNTSMTGYQEIITDPSYCDQILTMTYPLIGNYGIRLNEFESDRPRIQALVVRETPGTDFIGETNSLPYYLAKHDIPILTDVDTRRLVKMIRRKGTLKGVICSDQEKGMAFLKQSAEPARDQVKRVSTKTYQHFDSTDNWATVVALDFGIKSSIISYLLKEGLKVIQVPYNVSFEDIQKIRPQGVLLSNGPGDPKDVEIDYDLLCKLDREYPLMGICLGHQLLALAHGAETEKMLFGHRGANHPVKDLDLDRLFMSSQNHSYQVTYESLQRTNLRLTHSHINDQSVEGFETIADQSFAVQFHPEAHSGPQDSAYLFKKFSHHIKRFWEGRHA
jgi:carbamoyl-phosphate synthase small subunit